MGGCGVGMWGGMEDVGSRSAFNCLYRNVGLCGQEDEHTSQTQLAAFFSCEKYDLKTLYEGCRN